MTVDVTVTNPDSSSATLVGGFAYEAPLWTPAEMTTALWLKADDSGSITLPAADVSEWGDNSGNARHATQALASLRPSSGSRSLNGVNVLNFDGGDRLDVSLSLIQPIYYQVAVGADSVSNSPAFLDGATGGRVLVGLNASAQLVLFAGSAITSVDALSDLGNGTIVGGLFNGALSEGFVNGASIVTGNAGAGSLVGPLKIGDDHNGDNGLDGFYGEIIVLPFAPTTAQRQLLDGYLAHKWGLAWRLPADHPYKVAPPVLTP